LTTRQDLARIKARALRTKIWFKALSKVERAIVDLTIKCTEKIRSNVLMTTITAIVNKILQSLEESFMVRAQRIGQEIVEALCAIAEKWGNSSSSTWKRDASFVKHLGVNALNT
jgi:5-carboxymethyl-2-hydroxymuconate isomerase